MDKPIDSAPNWHDDTRERCPCGSTIQAHLCMKSGLLTDHSDIDYILHVVLEGQGDRRDG